MTFETKPTQGHVSASKTTTHFCSTSTRDGLHVEEVGNGSYACGLQTETRLWTNRETAKYKEGLPHGTRNHLGEFACVLCPNSFLAGSTDPSYAKPFDVFLVYFDISTLPFVLLLVTALQFEATEHLSHHLHVLTHVSTDTPDAQNRSGVPTYSMFLFFLHRRVSQVGLALLSLALFANLR